MLLEGDGSLSFHAQFGAYHHTKLPRVCRDMYYYAPSAEILVVGTGSEVYRLDLEAGCFRHSLQAYTNPSAINVCLILL